MTGLATPVQVAEYLSISQDTLRQWAHRKQGPPYIMVGAARRYDWTELLAWLEGRTVRP